MQAETVDLCVPLTSVYGGVSLVAGWQLVRLSRREAPWTTQKALHALIFALCLARVAFFINAIGEWNIEEGKVRSEGEWHPTSRLLFFITDQLPDLIFFTVYSCVVLFWAELYMIAADSAPFFETVVYPATATTNVVAFGLLFVFWILYATAWSDDDFFVNLPYAIFIASFYLVAAVSFLWIGRNAATELKQVPIELQLRKRLLKEVGWLSSISTGCMILRALVMVLVADKPILLRQTWVFVATMAYFVALELFPLLMVLVLHRRMPLSSRDSDSTERARLFGGNSYQKGGWGGGGHSVESSISRLSGAATAGAAWD